MARLSTSEGWSLHHGCGRWKNGASPTCPRPGEAHSGFGASDMRPASRTTGRSWPQGTRAPRGLRRPRVRRAPTPPPGVPPRPHRRRPVAALLPAAPARR
ncbi:MAG: hypothetical protein MZW92_16055, partial [Comamonadaceae bacterium]|nr:hypothetical protein [Comamonadaceae bacterium]